MGWCTFTDPYATWRLFLYYKIIVVCSWTLRRCNLFYILFFFFHILLLFPWREFYLFFIFLFWYCFVYKVRRWDRKEKVRKFARHFYQRSLECVGNFFFYFRTFILSFSTPGFTILECAPSIQKIIPGVFPFFAFILQIFFFFFRSGFSRLWQTWINTPCFKEKIME